MSYSKSKSKIVFCIAVLKFKTFKTNLEKNACHSWHAASRPQSPMKDPAWH